MLISTSTTCSFTHTIPHTRMFIETTVLFYQIKVEMAKTARSDRLTAGNRDRARWRNLLWKARQGPVTARRLGTGYGFKLNLVTAYNRDRLNPRPG